MGAGFVLIAYYIQTNVITMNSVLIATPIAILVGAINMSNNIRDIEEDIVGGRKTLVILLGKGKSIQALAISFAVAYAWIFVLIFTGVVSPWAALILLSVKKPITAIRSFKRGEEHPKFLGMAMKSTALTNTLFGMWLAVGLFINYII